MQNNTEKKVKMSLRLHTVADMITPGHIVADVGTDHGYIPIHQVLNGLSPYAYACDVAKGPLCRAKENINMYGVGEKVETVLSDGLKDLNPIQNIPETVVIAGMGGSLICKILSEAGSILHNVRELILSPHSEAEEVRAFIYEHNMHIADENMIFDEGKYYVVIKAVWGEEKTPESFALMYGPVLIEKKHPVLRDYLLKELDTCEKILLNLKTNGVTGTITRIREIEDKIKEINTVLEKI